MRDICVFNEINTDLTLINSYIFKYDVSLMLKSVFFSLFLHIRCIFFIYFTEYYIYITSRLYNQEIFYYIYRFIYYSLNYMMLLRRLSLSPYSY